MADGSIKVLPGALASAAGELKRAADEGMALRGNFRLAEQGASGCAPEAAGAYQEMQAAMARGLAELQGEVARLGSDTGTAQRSYVATDRSAIPVRDAP